MKTKIIFLGICVFFIITGIIFLSFYLSKTSADNNFTAEELSPNVKLIDGQQIIDITVKSGYVPQNTVARAGVPTRLRLETKNTYDCSASVLIPVLNYQQVLAANEVKEVSLSAQQAKGTLQGLCSMGMYGFKIKFI